MVCASFVGRDGGALLRGLLRKRWIVRIALLGSALGDEVVLSGVVDRIGRLVVVLVAMVVFGGLMTSGSAEAEAEAEAEMVDVFVAENGCSSIDRESGDAGRVASLEEVIACSGI